MICNPSSKNDLTYLGSADLQSAASKIAESGRTPNEGIISGKCPYISNRFPVATEYETLHILQISVIVAPLSLNE